MARAVHTPSQKPKVAAIATVWKRPVAHAETMIPKLLAGYDLDGVPVYPSVQVVSIYVDQFPESDVSRRWAARFDIPIMGTIRDALTRGGDTLAVDAVLIVGEHGDYPWNEKGQHLYPRRRLFEESVRVMRESGRVVPLFSDKHFSYTWENAKWMHDTARELGMPFMAGSSLPVTFRKPDLDLPLGVEIEEALVLSNGPTESYGFHALETLQCMVERRIGGEIGVAAVELLHGDAFWRAWDDGRYPQDLYAAVLATCDRADGGVRDYYRGRPPSPPTSVPGPHAPVAFLVEYRDGLRATLLNLGGYSKDFAFGARLSPGSVAALDTSPARVAGSNLVATAFKLERTASHWHFNYLMHHVEQFFKTGKSPYPVERTLLTTGTLAALMDSGQAGRRLETPHLDVRYQSPAEPWSRCHGVSISREQVWGFKPEDV